jgi:hypothetical protein
MKDTKALIDLYYEPKYASFVKYIKDKERQKVREVIDECLMELVKSNPEDFDDCILLCSEINKRLGLDDEVRK